MSKILIILFLCSLSHISYCQKLSERSIDQEEFQVKMIDDVVVSPDGKEIAFAAVGKLHLMNLKNNKRKELSRTKVEYEFEPSFSKDQKNIIFCSWNESGYGKIHIWNRGTNWKKTLLITSGIYRTPSFSPDGNSIVYKKEIETAKIDSVNQKTEGLYIFSLEGGDPFKFSNYGDNPQFDESGERIIFQSGTYRFGSFVKTFESVDLTGNDKRTLFYGKYGHEYVLSPNGKKVAWQELGKIYVTDVPDTPIGVTADNQNMSIKEISDLPGNNLSWSNGGKTLSWSIADKLYAVELNDDATLQEQKINITYPTDQPEGVLAFTNARIITIEGDVIENGTIIVHGNKIVEIGFDIQVPKEAHAINCSGKTIMPGLIDLSPASNNYDYNLSPIQQWEYVELLRAGITTKLDGGFKIKDGLSNRELIKAGKLIGPRMLSGGVIIGEKDENIFNDESYDHYKKSNLMIADAFGFTAVQSYQDLALKGKLQLNNTQKDTFLVKADDIHKMIIDKKSKGADNHKLLKKYTLHNASLVGLSNEIGSIKVGKLADFIVLAGNPLEDIQQISNVTHTVINGRVYECATMEEVGNYRKRISRTPNSALYESLNRAMGSACCGFQH